ncbi:hypothetical protein C8Q75DRAFT_863110 [Abortiporus biennis]|nr:hypothetical protein C8Q75DRAFT_863110 [Abortiporus biennis]
MGIVNSYLSPESAAAVLVVAGAVSYGVVQQVIQKQPPNSSSSQSASNSPAAAPSGKKSKKKKTGMTAGSGKGAGGAQSEPESAKPNVVAFPPVVSVPGGFDSPVEQPQSLPASSSEKTAKKKKKSKKTSGANTNANLTPSTSGGNKSIPFDAQSESSATAPENVPTTRPPPPTKRKSPTPKGKTGDVETFDADGPWTRVETKKKVTKLSSSQQEEPSLTHAREVTASDAGITTSVTGTGNSSPVAGQTDDEQESPADNRKTLAEKLLPKPRKTGVEDMTETPDVPTVARVMRIQPHPDEKPAKGFSWGDYEDVETGDDDADGEDEGGWVVKSSRKPKRTTSTQSSSANPSSTQASEAVAKKQRQNAARNAAKKAARDEAEADRIRRLNQHMKDLERERMKEQLQAQGKKTVSGGMAASINEKGHLVWD